MELVVNMVESSAQEQGDQKVSILDTVRERIGVKSLKTEVRDAEIALNKVRALIAAPEKRLAEAEENVKQREAQVASAELDAATRALAGETVNDYTPLQAALEHDRNTVKAYTAAAAQIRAQQEPALQAAIAELTRAQIAERKLRFERAARKFREVWGIGIEAHAEMMEAYNPWEHEQLSILAFEPRATEPWDEAFNRFFNKPAPQKPSDYPTRVIRFVRSWDKWSGTPDGGDEACMASEQEALDAVTAGAAVYVFDTPETQELTERAAVERARLKKYPGTRLAEDFPQQN